MVPSSLRHSRRGGPRRRGRALLAGLAVALAAAGCGGTGGGDAAASSSDDARAAYAVREQYTAPDIVASGAWTWTAPGGPTWVMIDAQSAVEDVIQARADLWRVADGKPERYARSEVLPSVSSMDAFVFEDLDGDGVPEFLGAVADSSEEAYVVFLPGARANLVEEIQTAGAGYRFSTAFENLPTVLRGGGGAVCAVQLWAEAPAPDSLPDGWRYLAFTRGGALERPSPIPPPCGT